MFRFRFHTAAARGTLLALCLTTTAGASADVKPHAGMLRYPDVSAEQIVFSYANDLWLVPRQGGLASPLSSPDGLETFPRFSPDGQTIAFVGNYAGDRDLYTIPTAGGIPHRVTHHPTTERITDWSPDGNIIFQAGGMGEFRFLQLFTVPPTGGLPHKLPVPYGANGVISGDGQWLIYTPEYRDERTWKRYRGGRAADVWLFHLTNHTSRKITNWEGTDSIPMWHNGKIYYLSDAGDNHRLNIWVYDPDNQNHRQITDFADYDVKWPAVGPGPDGDGEIVFQLGAELRILDLQSEQSRTVQIRIPGDRPTLLPERIDASDYVQGWNISPSGKRAVFEARGDIWTVPAENGIPRNLTRTSGVAERDPAWSPDAKWISYFSDADGEYDLYITQSDGKGETRKVAALGEGYRRERGWSPDSKHLAFVDNAGSLFLCEIESGKVMRVDTDPDGNAPSISWSHDSRWILYTRTAENSQSAVWVFNVETLDRKQLTSAMFNDYAPTFDRKGKYIFYVSNRAFNMPIYEDVGSSFAYVGTPVVLAVPLRADAEYPWPSENDEESWEDEDDDKQDDEGEDEGEGDESDEEKPDDSSKDQDEDKDGEEDKDEDKNGDKDDEEPKEEKKKPEMDMTASGVWEGMVKGDDPLPPTGIPFTLVLRVTKEGTVAGSFNAGPYHSPITGGAYDAGSGDLSFNLEIFTGETTEVFVTTATISGESISGTISSGDFVATFEGARTSAEAPDAEEEEEEEEEAVEEVVIDFDGFESRAIRLPLGRGYFYNLAVNHKNELFFVERGLRGSGDPTKIRMFDIEDDKKTAKDVAKGGYAFIMSADGKKLMVAGGGYAIVDARAGQNLGKKVPMRNMTTVVEPREEWRQIFHDAWRIQRDYFYVANMHGVDWPAVREQYERMLDDCVSRDDLRYVIAEMISELNVGHAYFRAGASERGPRVSVGLLGVDFELHDGAYRIAKIYEGGSWDDDARGPLSLPGVDVKEGDYLLAVNGLPLDTSVDPWAAFEGLAGDTVLLTVSEKPTMDDDAREVLIETLRSDGMLRYWSWVEANRKFVEEQTDGRVGYLHVPDTGRFGQNNLFRQFYGQRHKEGLIVDERWNGGGQIPTRFIELLNRPLLNYWKVRHGRQHVTPGDAHFGPKCMLINGSAGSGGDMFPALFRQVGLGKLIGRRTWGGLVGISGNPRLIDGTSVTVPTFGYYEKDGTWGIEGHGVDPDFEVLDDPAEMVDGGDPQLEFAIKHMLERIEAAPYVPTPPPAAPDRSGMGVPESDW